MQGALAKPVPQRVTKILQWVGGRWLVVATVLAVAAGHVAVAVALSAKRGGGKATDEVEYAGVADVGLLSDQTAAASLGLAGLSGQGWVGPFDLAAPDEEPRRYCRLDLLRLCFVQRLKVCVERGQLQL